MSRLATAALGILPLSGCSKPSTEANSGTRVDHIILGAPNLEEGVEHIERMTGVRPVIGGSHPGRGTRNALMSLGDGTYLELLAPDPAQSVDSEMVRELQNLTQVTPVGWAVSGKSEAGLRARLGTAGLPLSASEPGSRQKPDGTVLRWVTFGYEAVDNPLVPFFIIWADPARHPSRTSPGGCRLETVEIQDPAAKQLLQAIKPLGLNVSVKQASKPHMRISMRCKRGALSLG